jgi:uncharacterized repeat protein (TIGR01451 family)
LELYQVLGNRVAACDPSGRADFDRSADPRSHLKSQSWRRWPRSVLRATIVFLAVAFAYFGTASVALAQSNDWIANVNDVGFDPTIAGGTITYQVTVDNSSATASPATSITLAIPAGTTFTGATGTITGCAPTPATGPASVVCTVPAMAADGRVTAAVNLQTSTAGTFTLNVSVPTANDPDTANNVAGQSTTVTAGANMRLQLAGPATAPAGGIINYTFTATNLGPSVATNETFTFPIPTGLVDVVPPPGCTLSGSTYSCLIPGPIAVGSSVTLPFSAQISAGNTSTITAIGTVAGSTPPDGDLSNNTATLNTTISAGSDLTISKSRAPAGTLLVGDTVTFTLSPSYTGDSPSSMVVTDVLPSNYTFVSVVPAGGSGWVCSRSGQTVTCNKPTGSVSGADVPLGDIVITARATGVGSPVNTGSIRSTTPIDPNLGNNSADDGGASIVAPFGDLAAGKTGPAPALVVVGNSYDFGLSATNLGNAPFFGTLVLTDAVPAGLTITSYALNGFTCTPAPNVVGPASVVCSIVYTSAAPLLPGQATPTIVTTGLVTAPSTLQNSVTVSSPNGNLVDVVPGNNTATYSVGSSTGAQSADISVIKTRTLATVLAGDVETFAIEIVNAGPVGSSNVIMSDTIAQLMNSGSGPTGQGFISASIAANSASGVACFNAPSGANARQLSCTIATLPVCTAGVNCPVVTVQVRPGGNAGPRSNQASAISTTTADPVLGNNIGATTYDVIARTDVTVTKIGSPNPATAGQDLTYIIAASSIGNGLSDAANVTITDTLPANVVFVSATPTAGTCSTAPAANSTTGPGNNQLVCNLGTVPNGAQQTVSVVVRPLTTTRLTTLVNTVGVTTTTPETDTTNNSASVSVPVQNPGFDLLVNKSESVDPVAVGDNTVYTIAVINLGPSAIENVVMTDTMPTTRLSFVSFTVPSDGACGTVPAVGQIGGIFRCSFAKLPAGATRNITVTMRGAAKGTVTNNVVVTSDESALGFDSNTANNSDGESTTVRTRADMEVVSKVASPNPVDLREPFTYSILVRNNTGGILAEADNTVLSDSLPAGMELSGTPTAAVVSGTITANSCTGVSGSTSFTCDFGTFSSGGQVRVTVPVRVTNVTSIPQSYRNTATIATSSLDVQPSNDSNFGDVSINSSSISGAVYLDFNNGGTRDPLDSGLGGVVMTLTGTAFDGTPINATATTDPTTGAYTFGFLPRGNYTISRGVPGIPYVNDGTDTAGTAGGTLAPPTQITTIALPTNNAATGYLFAVVPQARIGLAKSSVGVPVIAPDGSFTITFRLNATNFSLEALNSVTVSDPLTGSAPGFGSQVTLASPLTSPMTNGTYTLTAAPSGTCGGLQAGFNGASSPVAASGFSLAAGASCAVDFTIRVKPTVPLPTVLPSGGLYDNQATVTGVGALSGQTEATNPQLRDLSQNGTTADVNANGQSNEAGENDPTPVTPSFTPAIALVKTATTNFSSPPIAGDTITYAFAVTNTGNVNLTGVSITDILPGLTISGSPIALLAPGVTNSTAITGTYTLTQADVDAGQVINQATVTGTDPFNTVVTDQSGSANDNNTPTITPIAPQPSIAVIKVANAAGVTNPAQIGNVITYTFTVRNTGNVTLTNVVIADPKLGVTLVGGPIATLAPGGQDTTTFTASYAVTQGDIDAAGVTNTATATGTTPTGGTVTDDSGTTLTNDTPTVVPLATTAAITLVKSSSTAGFSSPPAVGDVISYAFSIRNTGSVTLSGVTLSDTLPGIVIAGGPLATLAPGATDATTFTATYTLTQANLDAGQVVNSATVRGTPPTGPVVSDVSGSDATNDAPTITPIASSPSITLVKLADTSGLSNPAVAGDVIVYDFTATNTGNVTLTNVRVTDPLVGIVLTGGPIASLAPGATDSTTFSATYTLTQADVDAGQVINTADVFGTPPTGPDVTDTAGTAVDNDLPVITNLGASPSIRLQKTANTTALSVPPKVGDVISYAFTVRNTGNVTLSGITLLDPLPGINVLGGPIATLAPGTQDAVTFTATYALTQADIDAGGVQNQATATGTAPGGAQVSDISGTDLVNDAPTVTPLGRAPAISVIKSATAAFSTPAQPGDIISYTFTVRNEGNVTLSGITLTDVLPGLVISGGPIASLAVGGVDNATFTGSYAISQADINLGRVENSATVSGTSPTGATVTDTSGSTAANDTPTVILVPQSPAITLDKTYTTSGNPLGAIAGDVFTYTFTITNTGNTTLTNVTLTDPLPGLTLTGGPIASLAPAAVDSVTYSGTYTVSVADLSVGFVNNTATVVGEFTNGTGVPQTVRAQDSVSAVVMTVDAISEVFPPIGTNGGSTTIMLASDLAAGQPATLTPGLINSVILTVVATSDPGITLNTTTGIITLAPNLPAGIYTVTYQICSELVPTVCDTATETVNQLPIPAIETTKTQVLIDDGNGVTGVGDTLIYTITVENTGNTPISNLTLADTMTAAVSGAPLTLDAGPTFVSSDAGSTVGTLQIGETATYSASFVLTIEAVSGGGVSNTVTATGLPFFGPGVIGTPSPISDVSDDGIDVDGNTVDDPTVLLIDPIITTSGLILTKTTPVSLVQRGSVVPYTITVQNTNVAVVGVVNIIDTLPPNFIYVDGSATLNGTPVTPLVAGRRVTFTSVPVPPLSIITLTVSARILTGAAAGSHKNVVDMYDPATGVALASQASATVRIEPEPVFDCGDVIGKVFDDVNRNGYQDGPDGGAEQLLTNDDAMFTQKYGGAPEVLESNPDVPEPGLPGVRIVGVDGTIITTDAFGRYHVPCAALPASRGSNFILKLDARSLPSGYRLTTENPRVMRLTRGKMSEMNFGAALTRVARVDLNANAFVVDGGTISLVGALASGIDKLLNRIIDTPTNVRLAFHLPLAATNADERQARRDLAAVERYIRRHWDKIEGRYKLTVEKTIVREQ